jgi:hypothetical protein
MLSKEVGAKYNETFLSLVMVYFSKLQNSFVGLFE